MNMRVPNLERGERSLPSQLRVAPGHNYAQRRLMTMTRTAAGMNGLGQCDVAEDGTISCTNIDPVPNTDPIPNLGPLTPPPDPFWFDPTPTTGQSGFDLSAALVAGGVPLSQQAPFAMAVNQYVAPLSANGGNPTVLNPNSATPQAPNGYQWATLLSQSGQSLAKILTISQGGSSVTLPNGTQLLYGSNSGAAAASSLSSLASSTGLSSNMLVMVGIGLVAFMLMGRGK